jgi:pilus assembly protein Flp/PilA
MKTFINMLRDDSGASAAEYALILAIVGAGIATAAFLLGESITGAIGAQAERITECTENPDQGCDAGGGAEAPAE